MSTAITVTDQRQTGHRHIYLHYVFDLWAHRWRRRQARGGVAIVRFADDFVVGFEHRYDAERFLTDLRKRYPEREVRGATADDAPEVAGQAEGGQG